MAEIIKINPKNPDKKTIEKAAKILRNGGAVIYPTDTLYGLGVNASDSKAVLRVFEIKGRENKPISVAIANLTEAKKYAKFSPLASRIAKKFLPGPLTLILPSRLNLPKELNPNDEKVRIRIPDSKIALELIKKCKFPLTATSANLSGGKNPITAREAIRQIGDKVDLVLDAGKCRYNKPSTVVDLSSNKIEVVREGVISKKELEL